VTEDVKSGLEILALSGAGVIEMVVDGQWLAVAVNSESIQAFSPRIWAHVGYHIR
jgi:hypothetical protein